jgi:hypothetical protein
MIEYLTLPSVVLSLMWAPLLGDYHLNYRYKQKYLTFIVVVRCSCSSTEIIAELSASPDQISHVVLLNHTGLLVFLFLDHKSFELQFFIGLKIFQV